MPITVLMAGFSLGKLSDLQKTALLHFFGTHLECQRVEIRREQMSAHSKLEHPIVFLEKGKYDEIIIYPPGRNISFRIGTARI